jgi:multidrug efflux pump subunit AcrB
LAGFIFGDPMQEVPILVVEDEPDMAREIAAQLTSSWLSGTTTVNDIEHIELQSVTGYGIVKIFFQPTVDINGAQAQVTSISQTVLKLLPPGITPPIVLSSTRRASLLSRLLFLAINYRRRSSTISG